MTYQAQKSLMGACLRRLAPQTFHGLYDRTFEVLPADTDERRRRVFRLRHQVYCVENHFFDARKYPDGLERDAFDDRAIHFLMIHKSSGNAVGTLRVLLPDDRRPLVSFELHKTCEHPLLGIENRVLGLCEISRFCMAAPFRRRMLDGRLLPSYYDQEDGRAPDGAFAFRRRIPYAPLGLLRAAFETATARGFHACLLTLETGQLESFARMGLQGRPLGPGLAIHGGQQPLLLTVKTVLDRMAQANRPCWEVITGKGVLQRRVGELCRLTGHEPEPPHDAI